MDECAYLSSIAVFVNSLNRLRSQVGKRLIKRRAYAVHPSGVFNSLEVALTERLEALRRRPGSDS